jgi:hypothetical protein
MMNFALIGAAALSLMLATPAMARQHGFRHVHVSHRVSGAYAFDRGYGFAPGNVYNDFDRRNTFN